NPVYWQLCFSSLQGEPHLWRTLMKSSMFRLFSLIALATALGVSSAQAGFNSFVIRNGAGDVAPGILPNTDYVPDATEFVISLGGQKAGVGSSDLDGKKI